VAAAKGVVKILSAAPICLTWRFSRDIDFLVAPESEREADCRRNPEIKSGEYLNIYVFGA
jgi:hypothetical protein